MPTILVIEDNAPLRGFYRAALEDEGYRVVEAGDGRAGLKAYREQPADLVVCDLFMPAMDGLEVIRRLRGLAPGVKVVALSAGSAHIPSIYVKIARLLGAVEALAKPFAPDQLVDAVRAALAG